MRPVQLTLCMRYARAIAGCGVLAAQGTSSALTSPLPTTALQARLIDPSRDPYDVLLEDYEKGMTGARLDEIFDEVRPQACVSRALWARARARLRGSLRKRLVQEPPARSHQHTRTHAHTTGARRPGAAHR